MAAAHPTTERATAHFDADAVAATQEAPTLQVGNLLYRGRLLSIEEWLPFWERLQAIQAKPVAENGDAALAALRERTAFYRDYLRAVFPKRDYRFWAPDPVKHLMAQPFEIVEKTLAFFFILQARATFGTKTLEEAANQTTGGPSSPDKTPESSRPSAASA